MVLSIEKEVQCLTSLSLIYYAPPPLLADSILSVSLKSLERESRSVKDVDHDGCQQCD